MARRRGAPTPRTPAQQPTTPRRTPRTSGSLQPRGGRLDDRVDQRDEPRRSRARRRRGRTRPASGCGSPARARAEQHSDQRERHVDHKTAAPVEPLEQQAAGERPEPDADAASAAQMAIAFARSSRGNTFAMIDSVAGMIIARADAHRGPERDHLVARSASERGQARRTPKMTSRPAGRACGRSGRRASRTPAAPRRRPAGRSRPSTAAESRRVELVCSVGRATFRTVLSSPMMTRLRESTPRVFQRRA